MKYLLLMLGDNIQLLAWELRECVGIPVTLFETSRKEILNIAKVFDLRAAQVTWGLTLSAMLSLFSSHFH
jgi:hypothetical protein